MEEIINKYKDANGFVKDTIELFLELRKSKYKDKALEIQEKVIDDNKRICKELEMTNNELKSIITNREDKEYIDYVKKEDKKDNREDKEKQDKDISGYIKYLEDNNFDEVYLKSLSKDILINILSHYKGVCTFYKSMLVLENNNDELNKIKSEIDKYNLIINKILFVNEEVEDKENEDKNKITYFMNKDLPYIYLDIEDNIEIYLSIYKLIKSIENGTFKNLSSLVGQLQGLFEVRDLSNMTRVIFKILNDNEYCIIGAVTNKAETNSIYQSRLVNRYKLYKNNKDNVKGEDVILLKKVFKGDNNG